MWVGNSKPRNKLDIEVSLAAGKTWHRQDRREEYWGKPANHSPITPLLSFMPCMKIFDRDPCPSRTLGLGKRKTLVSVRPGYAADRKRMRLRWAAGRQSATTSHCAILFSLFSIDMYIILICEHCDW